MPDSLRSRAFDILLNQIWEPRYPSTEMMDRLEAHVSDRETAERYVELLIETANQDRYPSPMLLERILRLVDALEP